MTEELLALLRAVAKREREELDRRLAEWEWRNMKSGDRVFVARNVERIGIGL